MFNGLFTSQTSELFHFSAPATLPVKTASSVKTATRQRRLPRQRLAAGYTLQVEQQWSVTVFLCCKNSPVLITYLLVFNI